MPIRFDVSRADCTLEAAYQGPKFAALAESAALLTRLFEATERHGVKLSDIKIERGGGSFADFHILFYLFDFLLTVRVRIERVEIFCSYLSNENVQRFSAAAVDVLNAVRAHLKSDYKAYTLSLNLHGTLYEFDTKKFLGQFAGAISPDIGPIVGHGVAYYLGTEDDRLFGSLTLDLSAPVPGGLFARPQATWDGGRVKAEDIITRAEQFVRRSLGAVGLELPPLPQ